jgi:hypothetical protein
MYYYQITTRQPSPVQQLTMTMTDSRVINNNESMTLHFEDN